MRRNVCVTEEGFNKGNPKKKSHFFDTLLAHVMSPRLGGTDLWLCCTRLMKDLPVLHFGETAGLRKRVILGHRATAEQGLTPVPETPPGCQMDLFFKRGVGQNKPQAGPLTNLWFREIYFYMALKFVLVMQQSHPEH